MGRRVRRADQVLPVESPYQVRFIAMRDIPYLVNLYHLAKTAVGLDRHARMVRASEWFHNERIEVTALGAYKDLEGLLA